MTTTVEPEIAHLDYNLDLTCENPDPGHDAHAEYAVTFHCQPCDEHLASLHCQPCTIAYLVHAALGRYVHECGRVVTATGKAIA